MLEKEKYSKQPTSFTPGVYKENKEHDSDIKRITAKDLGVVVSTLGGEANFVKPSHVFGIRG